MKLSGGVVLWSAAILMAGLTARGQVGVDPVFNPGAQPSSVLTIAVETNGNLVFGGSFSVFGGAVRLRLARVDSSGTLDASFNPTNTGTVRALAIQPDGQILVGGTLSVLASQSATNIGRLNPDGTRDTNFTATANGDVRALAVQPDGAILVGGSFSNLSDIVQSGLGRLTSDGANDTNFTASVAGTVLAIALQPDGAIVIGGAFTNVNGIARTNLARVNSDGTLDNSFQPSANGSVSALALQPDGRIILGGAFTVISGQSRQRVARLDSNGAVDASFNPGSPVEVLAFALQANGDVIFDRNGISRVHPDGTIDPDFHIARFQFLVVSTLALQADGALLVGGQFNALTNIPRVNVGRIINNVSPLEQWTSDGPVFTWMRGGSGPEFIRTTLEGVTNGSDWSILAEGVRIPGGWQATLPNDIPTNVLLRARGFVANQSWFIQTHTAPEIIAPPKSVTLSSPSFDATFTASAYGLNLTYQWLRDGVPVSGATNVNFTAGDFSVGHTSGYSVVVSNSEGSVTSSPPAMVQPAVYVSTFAGLPGVTGTNDGAGTNARFSGLWDVSVDSDDNVLVADRGNGSVRQISPSGVVSTVAKVSNVGSAVRGPDGDIYAAAITDNSVVRVSPSGSISTVVTFSNRVTGVAFDSFTNLYAVLWNDHSIRKIAPDGTMTVFVGHPGVPSWSDGSPGYLSSPEHMTFDSAGNGFVADALNNMIRKITPAGMLTRYAGNPQQTGSTDGFATNATFWRPKGVAADSAGNVYVADTSNSTIRKITPAGIVSTIAGAPSFLGDFADGPGPSARFAMPPGIAVDRHGNIYVADTGNRIVRKIVANFGQPIITAEPQNVTAAVGSTALFSVVTAGPTPQSFQWFYSTNMIVGATNASLSITNLQLSDAGVYSVAITNQNGWARSLDAFLTVIRQPRFDIAGNMNLSSDGFYLAGSGFSGHGEVVVYTSTNLFDWEPILTNPPVIGSLDWLDHSATNHPIRFYRFEER